MCGDIAICVSDKANMAHTSTLAQVFSLRRFQPHAAGAPHPASTVPLRPGAVIDGWPASPNPFSTLQPTRRSNDAAEFVSSINNTVIRAIEWRDAGKWSIAERHLQSAIWMAIAANDALSCLMAGVKLVECYLGAGDMLSAMNLSRQLLPLAAACHDREAFLTLTTARCLCVALSQPPDCVRQELASCLLVGTDAPADPLSTGFDEGIFNRVARMLDRAHERERLSQWRSAWADLRGRVGGAGRKRLRRLLRANAVQTV